MTINLNNITLELPDGSKIEISNDGMSAKVVVPETVIERIVVVETEGPETIRIVPVNNAFTQPNPLLQPNPTYVGPCYPYSFGTADGQVGVGGGGSTPFGDVPTVTWEYKPTSTVYI